MSILSVRHYEDIADKVKISNLYFMIFIVQRYRELYKKYKFNNIRLQNFSIVVQIILWPSDTLTEFSNELYNIT